MCFRDVCFNAKNFTKSKQPVMEIHLLWKILASSTPMSASEEEITAKNEDLGVKFQSFLSVGTAIILSDLRMII